ncbi:hypothetical protein Acy02nite_90130 [Actinoplanes cyaneus]|uniref:Uncharacterized protein n=2 Tax=Actinoplanes cyaneus TaxID=52696 RepID=A0A919IV92_9ACTN|nr:hypothetical protein [Actinoplanes cyaneus]GID71132.1 hypothetical protein Acy02nite_90130 [Actinoplanes cyaneus]
MPAVANSLSKVLLSLVLVLSGCGVAPKVLGKIVLEIGTEIAVDAGADYLKQIFTSDEAKGKATLIVSYTNAAGDGVGTNYAIAGADAITTQNVTIEDVKGEIHIVGNGNGIAVTAAGGTTGKIAIELGGAVRKGAGVSSGEDQAATIDGILRWSGRSRSALFAALNDLDACRDVDDATDALRGVANGRAHQIDALQGTDVSALSGGGALRDTLVRALTFSLRADQAFVRWGESGCGKDGNHADGMRYSRSATATKRQFIGRWNPIASGYGLPTYAETGI